MQFKKKKKVGPFFPQLNILDKTSSVHSHCTCWIQIHGCNIGYIQIARWRDSKIKRDDLFAKISKLRDEEIQIARWRNPNCDMRKSKLRDRNKTCKSQKSKLRDGMKKDGKCPNCEMKLGII